MDALTVASLAEDARQRNCWKSVFLIRTGSSQPHAGSVQRKRHTLMKTLRKRSAGSRGMRRVEPPQRGQRTGYGSPALTLLKPLSRSTPMPRTADALRWLAWAVKRSTCVVVSCIERIRSAPALDNPTNVEPTRLIARRTRGAFCMD